MPRPITSARGQVLDKFRGIIREMLSQVPSLSKVPEREQGIKKDRPIPDSDGTITDQVYFYNEKLPTGVWAEIEFHVDPSNGWTHIYVLNAWSNQAVDHFEIEDIEDYAPAEIDRIDEDINKIKPVTKDGDEEISSSVRLLECAVEAIVSGVGLTSFERNAILSKYSSKKVASSSSLATVLACIKGTNKTAIHSSVFSQLEIDLATKV